MPEPRFVAVAVNITGVLSQIGPIGETTKLIDGVMFAVTNIVMPPEDALLENKQDPPEIVMSQETILPLASVDEENMLDKPFCNETPFTLKL